MASENPLVQVAMKEVKTRKPDIQNEVSKALVDLFELFLAEKLAYAEAAAKIREIVGFTEPLDKLKQVLEISKTNTVIPPSEPVDGKEDGRKKAKAWSQSEDLRLMAAIHKHGTCNWSSIAAFVGNGRTRPQCSQRWHRTINPNISKAKWTAEENAKLISLVNQYGLTSWSKIASEMKNRCDVQCRYHYFHLVRSTKYDGFFNEQKQGPEKDSLTDFNYTITDLFNIAVDFEASPWI